MSETTHKATNNKSSVEEYIARIPVDLRDLLVPDSNHLEEFAVAIKSLRLKEEERYYVTDIQRRHRLPIRPNESVKGTMIRVRLAILRKFHDINQDSDVMDIFGPLPIDPLE